MPWKIVKDGENYCLEKEDTGERVDGSCHPDRAETEAMMQAMYASENKAAQDATVADKTPPDAAAEDSTDPAEQQQPVPETATVNVPAGIRKLVLNIGQAAEAAAEQVAKALRGTSDEVTGFKVAGNHWLAVWSNNFKDRDGEVFTQQAMEDYVARVDLRVTPPPSLWVWHAGKQVEIGSTDYVGTHGHFLMAAGQFYMTPAAQAAKGYYARHAKDTGISHGFTYPSDKFDGKHYHQFNTFEISLLPRGTEANLYTSLEGVKAMALDERKVKYLKDVFGEDHATKILAEWEARGKALEDLGVEFKDFTAPDSEAPDAAAHKEAVDHADKAFGELLGEVLNTSAEPVTAALEAVKAVKAARADIETLRGEIDALRTEMQLRPRVASQDKQTEVKESDLPDAMQKAIDEQRKIVDPFWGAVTTNGNHGG